MKRTFNWAFIGTGNIASSMAKNFIEMNKPIYSAWNRTSNRATKFGENFNVEKIFTNCDEMLSDPSVDIVYIATTHDNHIDFIKKALKQKKHVLCEKSITLNSGELTEAISLAKTNDVILAEAMTIWHMPLYKKLWDVVKNGELGKLQMINVTHGISRKVDLDNRFFSLELGGGTLLDIGVYALSFARSFMEFQPNEIISKVEFEKGGADNNECIILSNESGQLANITLSFTSKIPIHAVMSFDKGYIEIEKSFLRADTVFIYYNDTNETREITVGKREDAMKYEIINMEKSIINGNSDIMMMDKTIDVMEIMTTLRKDWGMKFNSEK